MSDDEEELGLGVEGLSLPSFVAGFLKGVADRLQVKASDITIRVDMEMKQDGSSRRQPENRLDLVTGLLSIREANAGAVSARENEVSDEQRKRLVSLSGISMALVSDPVVFSNYSRFASPASPSTTMHSKESRFPSRVPSPPPQQSSPSDLAQSATFGRQDTASRTLEPVAPENEGSPYPHGVRFSDAGNEAENCIDKDLENSQRLSDDDRLFDNPAYLDSVIDSQMDDDIEGSGFLQPGKEERTDQQFGNSGDTPRSYSPQLHTSVSTGRGRGTEKTSNFGDSGQEHGLHSSETAGEAGGDIDNAQGASPEPPYGGNSGSGQKWTNQPSDLECTPSRPGSGGSQSGSSNAELLESKVFSNEDAQSMYMSAASHGSTSRSFMPNMPGAWHDWGSTRFSRHSTETHFDPSIRQIDHDGQDETTASTPKLSAQSGQYSSDQRLASSDVNPEADNSGQSSPVFSKVTTGVAKTFLTVDKISLWLPSGDGEKNMDTTPHRGGNLGFNDSASGLQESTADDDLLESGNYAPTRFRGGSIDSPSTGNTHLRSQNDRPISHESDRIAIEISSIEVQLDVATGWLLAKMSQNAAHALGSSEGQPRPTTSTDVSRPAFSIALTQASVKFVEHIPGFAYPAQSQLHLSPSFRISVEDVILQAMASGLNAHYSDNGITKFGLDVSKFAIGFASENLLSFDEDLKMRESTRDILSPVGGDVSISLNKSADAARVNVSTLPLQVNLNIQRLDEVLSWLGGLSTILELGNSFSSMSQSKGTNHDPTKRPRGVHFAQAPPPQKEPNESTPWKVNARIGGISINVAGERHYLKLRTTAVKVVSRFEGIGIQIDKAKLSGPFALDDGEDTPAKISLGNIRVEYLFSPKEVDLDRLLGLITPSKDKYDEDDDIMLDTLFRQRRQGSVLRVTVAGMKAVVSRSDDLESLSQLGNELSRLSSVTKYLPEDDRPGVLILVLVKELEGQIHVGGQIGDISTSLKDTEVAYITMPSLLAAQVQTLSVVRNGNEELLGEALPLSEHETGRMPLLMARFIPDEMDPTVKLKLYNLRAEYTIQSIAAFLGLGDDLTGGRMATNMAKSLANLAEAPEVHDSGSYKKLEAQGSGNPTKLTMVLRDSVLGLNPRGTSAKGLLVFTSAKFSGAVYEHQSSEASLDLRKASIMVIDDVRNVGVSEFPRRRRLAAQSSQVQSLIDMGYVPVSSISSATATAKLMHLSEDGTKSVDVELRDNLLILETCADSTQTLIAIVNGLQPPTPPSATLKYRTEVMPIQDMLASFSGDAFATDHPDLDSSATRAESEDQLDDELEYVSDFYPAKPADDPEPDLAGSGDLLDSFHSQYHVSSSTSELDFRDDHFAKQSDVGGTAHRWDSAHNTYGLSNDQKLRRSPLRVRVRDIHVIWNLFDGYDWQRTRDTISKAVKDVEVRAADRHARGVSRASPDADEEEESVIGDCLFNSVYIGIPAHKDPRELRADINHDIDDLASETGSYATTSTVTATRQSQSPSMRGKKLRLSRSKHHKMTFELKGVCADLVVLPPDSEETQSSLDIRVDDLEIFDHVPTSTWKKFASYMHETGEKESGTSIIHLEILTVKPVPELAASEIVLKVGGIWCNERSNEYRLLCFLFGYMLTRMPSIL